MSTARLRRVTPRGRHAPPLEVRLAQQRRRLLDAGEILLGQLDVREITRLTTEQVSRAAGMSKATFYQHYADVHEFTDDLCVDLVAGAALGGKLHAVQHAAALCKLPVSPHVAQQIAEHLQRLGWTPPGSEAP